MRKLGQIFIVSAASGTGKTTLVSRLVKNHADIRVSVSHTTRLPRGSEQNGVHYHFVSTDEFTAMIQANAFLEYAQVHGHYYGTSVNGLQSLTQSGADVILEIDTQGAEQVRRTLPDSRSIFILPPSFTALRERLTGRGTDAPEVIARRLEKARSEIEQAYLFDYIVINDDLIQAENELMYIIKASRLRQNAQSDEITRILADS